MMAKALTTKSVENIKPGTARLEIPDAGCRGLYLIVQPSGRKSWATRYRFEQEPVKLTLGSWPALTLAAARKAATDALHELAQGRDPAALKFDAEAAAKKATAERAADTVDRWSKHFIERHAKKKTRPNSWQQAEHIFRNIVLPAWSGRTVHEIVRRDVRELVENVAEDRPVMANRVLAHVRRFFSWLCEQDIIPASPCAGVKPPTKEVARERILSDDEIVRLWNALDVIGGSTCAAIKVMLLTGQRRGEVIGMRRSEIAGDVWSLAAGRTKNGRAHEVPLSAQVLAIIDEHLAGDGPVFATNRTALFRTKVAIDERMRPAQPYVIHDLRRTCASGMAKLGVRLPVIEKCLNHISGSFRGIVGVYQRHDFATEKREALQRWADRIDEIVSGKTAKVIALKRKR
jgi:integrase